MVVSDVPQVKVGQGWWEGIPPVWFVDAIEPTGTVVLRRWVAEEGGVRESTRPVSTEGLLRDGAWSLAPEHVVEAAVQEAMHAGAAYRMPSALLPTDTPTPHHVHKLMMANGRVLAEGWRERARQLRRLADELDELAREQELDRH